MVRAEALLPAHHRWRPRHDAMCRTPSWHEIQPVDLILCQSSGAAHGQGLWSLMKDDPERLLQMVSDACVDVSELIDVPVGQFLLAPR